MSRTLPAATAATLALGVLLAPTRAHADAPDERDERDERDEPTQLDLHATGGVEVLGAGPLTSVVFRGQALVGMALGTGHVRPTLDVGYTLGVGDMYVDDPRAAAGPVGLAYTTHGPIVQLGLDLRGDRHDGYASGARLFVSGAYLQAHLDESVALTALRGVPGEGAGVRGTVGFNWARAQLAFAADGMEHSYGKHDTGFAAAFLFLVPQQIELTVERDLGPTRWGATFSWGI